MLTIENSSENHSEIRGQRKYEFSEHFALAPQRTKNRLPSKAFTIEKITIILWNLKDNGQRPSLPFKNRYSAISISKNLLHLRSVLALIKVIGLTLII